MAKVVPLNKTVSLFVYGRWPADSVGSIVAKNKNNVETVYDNAATFYEDVAVFVLPAAWVTEQNLSGLAILKVGDTIVQSVDIVAEDSGVAGGAGPSTRVLLYKSDGDLQTGWGLSRFYNDTDDTWTILSIRATVDVSPAGGSVIIDVNKNDTTLFTNQDNRPTILAGELTSGKVTDVAVSTISPGEYLTVDVDQIAASASGLIIQIVVQG